MSKDKRSAPPFTGNRSKSSAPGPATPQRPRPPAAPRVQVRSKASSRGR